MKFSVCIPATRPDSLGATIRSIQDQTVPQWELLVVGQGEDHQVRQVVEAAIRRDSRVRYLHINQRGSSRARNAAIRAASGQIIAMTDDDCEAQPDWLAVLAECMTNEPEVALVGGALIAPPPAGSWPAWCPHLVPAEALYDPVASRRHPPFGWDWVGANFAVRREIAQRFEGFDEHLGVGSDFPSAGDWDYKLRMEALGLKVRSTPRAVVTHTYGWRYGPRAVLKLHRRYARGIGGLAAKLTMLGDPRGKEWLAMASRDRNSRWLVLREPYRLPIDLLMLWHFRNAYRGCLRHYRLDERGLLTHGRHVSWQRAAAPGSG